MLFCTFSATNLICFSTLLSSSSLHLDYLMSFDSLEMNLDDLHWSDAHIMPMAALGPFILGRAQPSGNRDCVQICLKLAKKHSFSVMLHLFCRGGKLWKYGLSCYIFISSFFFDIFMFVSKKIGQRRAVKSTKHHNIEKSHSTYLPSIPNIQKCLQIVLHLTISRKQTHEL